MEEVNSDRQSFAQKLTSEAAVDLEKMGMGMDVLTIQISDDEDYLNALGKLGDGIQLHPRHTGLVCKTYA